MLLRLITDLKPTHVAVAFDRPKPTFRKKLFKGYQAKRPKMDEELVDQIPKVHALISGFGIPIFEKDGFEADDVIGTIAKHAKKDGIDQVIIVTGDRDILQLVEDEKILVWMPTKGLSQAKLYDEAAVFERMGVAPDKIPDFKALAGDPSDNYPGVPGIGPKTAVALLTKYKTIEDVLKTKELTKTEKESARMSHDLATIRTNVPIEGSLVPLGSLNRPEAVRELTTLGFRTLLKRITGEVSEKKEVKTEKNPDSHQQELF
jgi:DNA polymerase-1